MNTLKKIVAFALMATLLVCVAFAFASCNNATGEATGGDTHCPDDCECRINDAPAAPEHCPSDCACRGGSTNTPTNVTYVVVVRDDQGNIVPGVSVKVTEGTGFVEKVTDETGYLTFSLAQNSWYAQVVSVPAGYKTDFSAKYEFGADGVVAIELVKPVGYTFIAKSAYGDEVFADVVATLYAWNAETEYYDYDVPAAVGVTDEDGKVTLEAVAGKYIVEFLVEGQKYIEYVEIDLPSDVYEVAVKDNEGSSANNPYFVEYNNFEAWVENGSAVWYAVMRAGDKKIVINDADAFVIYNDQYYYADDDGLIEVALVEDDSNKICFAIGYASDAEDAEFYKDIEVALVAPVGSYENPIVLDDISDLDLVSLEANEDGNSIYYKWTPTFSGKFYLLCDNVNNCVYINNGSIYNEAVEGASVIPFAFNAFDEIVIQVAATETTEEYIYYEELDWGYFEETVTYVAADLDFDALVYAKYTANVLDIYGEAVVNAPVTFTNENGDVVASLYTDMDGMVEVLLPRATYFASTPAPEGYMCADYELTASDLVAYLSPSAYNLYDYYTEIQMAGGMFKGYIFELAAGETKNFMVRLNGTYKFKIQGAWGLELNMGRFLVTPDRGGVLSADFSGNMMLNGGVVEFALKNTTEDVFTVMAVLEEPVLGASRDNPIEITDDVTVYTAEVDFAVLPDGCLYYVYVPTAAGTLTVSSVSNIASFSINNISAGLYNDTMEADENTNADNPLVDTMVVDSYETIYIVVGTSNFVPGSFDFTVVLTPAE